MTTEEHNSTPTADRRTPLRRFAVASFRAVFNVAMGLMIIAAGAVVFVQTDAGRSFLTKQILSIVNSQINGTFTCDDVQIDVFRGIVIKHPRLTVQGATLLDAQELRVAYDIAALVGHTTAVNQFTLVRPTIHLVRGADSVWNFNRISVSSDTTPTSPSTLVLRLRDVSIIDGTINVHDQTVTRAPANVFDPSHLALRNVHVKLSTLIDLGKRDIAVVLHHLSLRDELSPQLNIQNASCAVRMWSGGVKVSALTLEMPSTSIALKGELLGVDIQKDGLTSEALRAHPFRAHVEAPSVYGPDIRYVLPFLDIRESYSLQSDVLYSGDRVFVSNMDLQGGSATLKGSVDITGLDGRTELYLHVLLHDSQARYADVRKRMQFLSLPDLPFIGTTNMKHIEMKGHPSDSLWFSVNGRDDMGEVDGEMTLHLNTAPMAYSLFADVRHGNLARIDPSFGSCDLNGKVHIQGRGFTLSELKGTYAVDLQRSTVTDRLIRSGTVRITAEEQGVTRIDTLRVDVTPVSTDETEDPYDPIARQVIAVSGSIDARDTELAYKLQTEIEGLDFRRLFETSSLPTGFSGVLQIDARGLTLDTFLGNVRAQVTEFSLEDRALLPFTMDLSSSVVNDVRSVNVTAPFAQITINGQYSPSALIASFSEVTPLIAATAMKRVQPFTETTDAVFEYPKLALEPMSVAFDVTLVDASPFNVFLQQSTFSTRSSVRGRLVVDSTKIGLFADEIAITDFLMRADSTTIFADPCTAKAEFRYSVRDSVPAVEFIDLSAECRRNVVVNTNTFSKPRVVIRGNDSAMCTRLSGAANDIDALVGLTSVYRNGQITLLIDTIATTIDKQKKLEWVSLNDAKVHVRNQAFDVTGLTLQRSNGEVVSIEGVCSLEKFSNLHLQVTDFNLRDLRRFVDLKDGHPLTFLDGRVADLDVYLNGSWENPVATMRVRADDIEYNHELIGSLNASIRYANKDIVGKLSIANRRIPNAPNTLSIDVRHLPFDLGLQNVQQRIVDGGVIDVDLTATQLALAAVEPFLPAVERVQGVANGKVTMRGTLPENLELGGSAVFKNTTFLASPTNIVYRAEGSLHLEGSKLHLDTIRLRNLDRDRRGGSALANGVVTFDGLSVSRVDFNVISKGILIMNKGSQVRNPKVFGDIVVASGSNKPIMFYGPLDAPVLSGDVDVLYADVIFPQDRAGSKVKYSAFTYQRTKDRSASTRSVLDTTTVRRVTDTSAVADRVAAADMVTDVIKSTTASFSDILRFNLNIYLRGRTLMTMVLGFAEILIADLEPVDVSKPLVITGRFLDNSTNMSGRVRVREGASTYKFYKPFSTSGTLDFTQGGLGNPTLDLKAIYNGRRMNAQTNEPEAYQVVIDISGTKQRPIAQWSYFRNQRKQEGDSAKVTGDALMLLLLGRTQDELTSTGQGNLVNEVNASLSAVATSALGDLLSGVGGLVQSVQMDLGADMSQTQLTVSGQLFSDVVYRLTGQVSDFAGNSTITVTVPFTVLNNADAMRYFNLDISRSVNNTGNITRFQRLWEIKLGARLP
jgi:hypothetical protein